MPIDERIIAALDLGTNTFKLSVFAAQDGVIEEVASENRVLRIARLIGSDGRLPESAVETIVAAARELANTGRGAGAGEFLAVATQGFRTAANGEEVIARITAETPWHLRMISGAEEADLTFEGLSDLLPEHGAVLIVDIGGGSTELVLARDRQVVASESLPIGSGALTDRYVISDPPEVSHLEAVSEVARGAIGASMIPAMDGLDVMIFSGGAGQFLDAIARKTIDPSLGIARLDDLTDVLLETPASDIATWLGIPVVRAQVIPAGHRIAQAAADRFQPASIVSAPSGIRLGLVRRHLAMT